MVNFSEVRRTQLAKSILLTSTMVPWDLFRSFKICSNAKEWGTESKGKLTHLFILSKTVTLVPEFAGQHYDLGSSVCSEKPALGQNTQMMMMLISVIIKEF